MVPEMMTIGWSLQRVKADVKAEMGALAQAEL